MNSSFQECLAAMQMVHNKEKLPRDFKDFKDTYLATIYNKNAVLPKFQNGLQDLKLVADLLETST